ncbi:uncharacterized protein LOC133904658 [Phragmites australis]|uniref:uncharacterized protein LOC133904658 n=1 Tax=Phragmites australis TaxID=29695 RepID=UPI002D76DD3E|nr:uncharacterized protein LOC133904658 [Phragmites australis]
MLQTGGRGATGSRPQARRGAAAGSSHQAGGRGAASSGAAAPGDKGKRPWSFVPQPSSSSPPRQWPASGGAKEGDRGDQSSGAEFATEARSRVREPKDQGRAGGATTGARADPLPEAGSTVAPQRPGGQSPLPKRRKADPGPKPQGPDFKIHESRWPPKDPARDQRRPEVLRPAPAPEPSVLAPEPKRARRGPSTWPPSSQAPEPLPDVLGSAREVIGWLEAAVAADRVELDRDHAALVKERGRLEEVGRVLEPRISSAHATHERSMRAVAKEREALEEVCDEAVAAQEKATCMERQATERDQASRWWVAELLAREWLLLAREEAVVKREKSVQSAQADLARRNDEFERSRADVLHREEEVAIRETDVEITATAQDAHVEQIARREAEAALAASALTAREEQAAKWEAELAARERALAALAKQAKRGQAEAPATSGVPTSAAKGVSLEERLQIARDEL